MKGKIIANLGEGYLYTKSQTNLNWKNTRKWADVRTHSSNNDKLLGKTQLSLKWKSLNNENFRNINRKTKGITREKNSSCPRYWNVGTLIKCQISIVKCWDKVLKLVPKLVGGCSKQTIFDTSTCKREQLEVFSKSLSDT